jgi:hypothetical protein
MKITSKAITLLLLAVIMLTSCNNFLPTPKTKPTEVQKVLVAGDNSTLTWASPCSNNWALDATNLGDGIWEIFIAPSLPSKIYTILFFYTDASIAMGMVDTQ